MKRIVSVCALVLLVCPGLSSAGAATVDTNEEWYMIMQPSESFTCITYFIPNTPNVPSSLIFAQAPQWTDTYPFDYVSEGWDTALTDGNKTAYLFGPEITNSWSYPFTPFSYKLYYQWEEEDVLDYPLYLDVVVFDDVEQVRDFALVGVPGSYEPDDVTWKEQYDPGSPPYENPVPEPMTICLLGLGAAFLRKRR